jgi:hypothetical protein
MRGTEQKLVLAIPSGGGHWQQLLRLRPAFERERTVYVTTDAAYARDVPGSELFVVTDANRNVPPGLEYGRLLDFLSYAIEELR